MEDDVANSYVLATCPSSHDIHIATGIVDSNPLSQARKGLPMNVAKYHEARRP
jgi:hypothetical protein